MMQHNDYLVHHGIDGQKWGVRNGPPYPLNKSDYSGAEKKAIRESKPIKKKPAFSLFKTRSSRKEYGPISGSESVEHAISVVNPHARPFQTNCVAISSALCVRNNDKINVAAKDCSALGVKDIQAIFPGIGMKEVRFTTASGANISTKTFMRELDSKLQTVSKNGQMGLIGFQSLYLDNGHMIAFKNEHGKIKYCDGQARVTDEHGIVRTGMWYSHDGRFKLTGDAAERKSEEFINSLYQMTNTSSFVYAVTTGCPVTEDASVLDKYFERGKR